MSKTRANARGELALLRYRNEERDRREWAEGPFSTFLSEVRVKVRGPRDVYVCPESLYNVIGSHRAPNSNLVLLSMRRFIHSLHFLERVPRPREVYFSFRQNTATGGDAKRRT